MAEEEQTLVIHSVNHSGSVVDGPGVRAILYVQGCRRRCAGCHNPETWDPDAGRAVPLSELIEDLRARIANRKLTISGGEPLQQAGAVLALLKGLPDFSIALYTGAELHEVPDELMRLLDFIKVGPYLHENRCTTVPYVGSSNQRFIDLRTGRS